MNTVWLGISGFLAGLAGAWFMARYAYALGLLDQPNQRSSHALPTPRGGGVGLFFATAGTGFLYLIPWGVWVPGCFLSFLSFVDDRIGLSSRLRLLIQLAAAILAVIPFFWGADFHYAVSLLILFWALYITGTANFYNFMDGINGMAGLTGGIAFGFLALYSWRIAAQPELTVLAVILSGCCFGFLPFNFPKAKVFMGDVGSILLGFLFAVMVFHLSNGLGDFLCLISFLFFFYADTTSTLYLRWRNGENLFEAHRKHLYQVLANELKLAHWKVTSLYGFMQLTIGFVMLLVQKMGVGFQIFFLILASFLFLLFSFSVRRRATILS